jgi:NAD(P)-dependent dehydrogenase (short-subunit alcohol dehydrogenase family)
MKQHLKGKVVWITGASSGIGRGLALEAAALGARLVLSSRRGDALGVLALECALRGAAGTAVLPFDLEDAAARKEACERAPGLLGRIDVLILNAGMSQRSTFLDTAPAVFDRIMNLDFAAQVDMARRCLPAMVERGSGTLVAISSIAGLAGAPLRPAYSSAKHALAGLFQNLRSELVGSGVRIVTIYPGYVRTLVARNALSGDGRPTASDDPHIEGGFDPAPVARRILRAVVGGKVEVKVAFDLKSRLGLFLSRHIPSAWATLSHRHAGLATRPSR